MSEAVLLIVHMIDVAVFLGLMLMPIHFVERQLRTAGRRDLKPFTAMSHMLSLAQCYMFICTVIDCADVSCLSV